MREDVEFDAEGVTLRGWLYLPDGAGGPVPTVVMGPRLLRGQGDVPGQLRGGVRRRGAGGAGVRQPQLRRQRQRAASGDRPLAAGPRLPPRDHLRADPLGGRRRPYRVWGTSYSGGHVLVLGAIDKRVRCVVAQVPLVSGFRNIQRLVRQDFLAA